jgi:predicted ATP-dependent endonuclease of OLD family
LLVEGPSDELLVQKAVLQTYGRTNLQLGVDIVSVKSLAFKRFLEISVLLQIQTRVVTDNDGDVDRLRRKYQDYFGLDCIEICYDVNEELPSLEDHLVHANGREVLNRMLQQDQPDNAAMVEHMKKNKTECALRIFNSDESLIVPEYIQHAIRELDN